MYFYDPSSVPATAEEDHTRRPRPMPWLGILGCIVGVLLLLASVHYLTLFSTQADRPDSHRRPSEWLKFYQGWQRVDMDGKEGFAVIQGGRAGTGDPMLTELINLFRNAADPEVRTVAERMMFHEDDRETYTQSKKDVFMCLKDTDKATKEYYSLENLAYVMAHELAHAWMKDYDPKHMTDEFHEKHERVLASVRTESFQPVAPANGYCDNVPRKNR
jgi:hypothetical protein